MTQNGGIQNERKKADKNKIQEETRSAIDILVKNGIDLIICEVCNISLFRSSIIFFLVLSQHYVNGMGDRGCPGV